MGHLLYYECYESIPNSNKYRVIKKLKYIDNNCYPTLEEIMV